MTNQNIANVVIAVLKEVELDGEMMEHIINEVGMRDQMVNQLYLNKVKYNLEQISTSECECIPGCNCEKHIFTEQQLIEYTREIQERCKLASITSVRGAGIDFDDMVELEMYHNRTIEVNLDESSLYKEIESAIDDAFETDDEAVLSEALDVIENMKEV
jgi:hypothetical protein